MKNHKDFEIATEDVQWLIKFYSCDGVENLGTATMA